MRASAALRRPAHRGRLTPQPAAWPSWPLHPALIRLRHLVRRTRRPRWSGLAKQIPAGLGFCLSGCPIGPYGHRRLHDGAAFSARTRPPGKREEWRELNAPLVPVRTFCPLTRLPRRNCSRRTSRGTFGGDHNIRRTRPSSSSTACVTACCRKHLFGWIGENDANAAR